MYVPRFNAVEHPADVDAFVAAVGAGDLVTVGRGGTPVATRLPLLWDRDRARLVAHFARANDHWAQIAPGAPGLVIVTGAQAYVSPGWYASKSEHGRVVPTWNYSAVHFSGTVTVHDDPDWVREAVTVLTERHESGRPAPWSVADAPKRYVAGQLRAIVGVEMVVDTVEAKAKLSQNRSAADRAGVVTGLHGEDDPAAGAVADAMEHSGPGPAPPAPSS